MEIKENILSKRENVAADEQRVICPEKEWFHRMRLDEKVHFIFMLLVDPALAIILFFYLTGVPFNILLGYVLVDVLLVLWCRDREIKRLKRIEEMRNQEDRMPIIRQKIQELKEIEAEMKRSGNH